MGTNNEINHPIIFFDGVCNLCNASVNFIIKRDKNAYFRFASLQSDFAKRALPKEEVQEADLQSIILLQEDSIRMKSTAALTIAKHLSGPWPLLYAFMIVPPFIRHFFYDLIARNRYKLFGKQDACMIPSIELKDRFID